MKKWLFCAAIALFVSSLAGADAVSDRYAKSCAVCHGAGVANAPLTGAADAWKPRLAKGMDRLVLSVKNGMGAMPPRGMCNDCADADYKALIQYMAAPKK